MTSFDKHPIEFYGKLVSHETKDKFLPLFERQHCPFLDKRCVKQRKSDSRQTIGSCVVGYKNLPLIICPHRFLQNNQIFLDCVRLLEPNLRYVIVPEVKTMGGNVDYFLMGLRGEEIVDYLGIEIQALDTTGSGGIWEARKDLSTGKLSPPYSYGINWKMSAKTILVQMHHKAAEFEALGKKLVLVVQTKFLDYIAGEFQTERVEEARPNNSVHFHSYDAVMLGEQIQLTLNKRKSTDVLGVERMLSAGERPEFLEEELLKRIQAKMAEAIELNAPG